MYIFFVKKSKQTAKIICFIRNKFPQRPFTATKIYIAEQTTQQGYTLWALGV